MQHDWDSIDKIYHQELSANVLFITKLREESSIYLVHNKHSTVFQDTNTLLCQIQNSSRGSNKQMNRLI